MSQVPSKFIDKDIVPRMPFLAKEISVSSTKLRSPSPPVRRPTSTDRGALLNININLDTLDNPPVMKQVYPSSISANKSVTNIHTYKHPISSKYTSASEEPLKQDDMSDLFNSLQRMTIRKVRQEKEDEQVKQALNVRQCSIRKSKTENKVRTKHQFPATNQKPNITDTLTDMDNGKMLESKRTNFSNPENEPVQLLACGTTRMHKLQRSLSRNSQHLDPWNDKNMLLTFSQ